MPMVFHCRRRGAHRYAPQVLFVGRLVEKKGCGDLIDALALCRIFRR